MASSDYLGLSLAHGAWVFQTTIFRSCERAQRLPQSSAHPHGYLLPPGCLRYGVVQDHDWFDREHAYLSNQRFELPCQRNQSERHMRLNPDDEALPVMVPRSDRALVGMSANRVQRLRN